MDDIIIDIDWEFLYHTSAIEKASIDANIFPFVLLQKNAGIIGNYLIYTYPCIDMIITSVDISTIASQKMSIKIYLNKSNEDISDELSKIKNVFEELFMREDYWNNLIDFERYFNIKSALNWGKL